MSTMTIERFHVGQEPMPLGNIVSDRMLAALKRGGADLSQLGVNTPEHDDGAGLWEDVAVPQAHARALAWRNSVLAADHDDYLKWRLADLDENQGPMLLKSWLDSLITAKKTRARPSTMNLVVAGNVGSGKTTGILALGNEASEQGLFVRMVQHSTYLAWRRPDGGPNDLSKYAVRRRFVEEPDLLILDELCGEMDGVQTDFVRRETTNLVGSRIAAGKPTAYSTNLRRDAIKAILGERLVSRIEDRAYLMKVVGKDRRQPRQALDW
ncbi:hypothetical protein [Streptomyces sp. NRRL B-24572]|uniref:hypothetical protein n=1 Tax=Streptomyces sp. NRRL B-24572 TaxID=1962156 RepID=UPI000A384F09|nr:hypothetical protein [Streptomyces sp. NRRL B-24572]